MKRVNINKLGVFLDGWAELIDNQGAVAPIVQTHVEQQLAAREMPAVNTEAITGYVRPMEPDRPYLLSSRYPGVTSAIYVRAHGEDLYVSWKTFQQLVPHWRRIGLLLLASAILSFLISFLGSAGLWATLFIRVLLWILWLAFFLASLVGLPYGAWWLYQKLKEAPSFRQQVDLTPTLDKILTGAAIAIGLLGVLVLTNIIPPPPGLFMPPLGSLLRSAILIFMALSIASAFLGILREGHPFAYFVVVPSVFDADDVIALNLSVHQTLLHALDQTGIDTSVLHLRRGATRGRIAENM